MNNGKHKELKKNETFGKNYKIKLQVLNISKIAFLYMIIINSFEKSYCGNIIIVKGKEGGKCNIDKSLGITIKENGAEIEELSLTEGGKTYDIESELHSTKNMFKDCIDLTGIEISISSQSLKDSSGMFEGCINLDNIKFVIFNTPNNLNMSRMFFNCSKLQSIDFGNNNFVTSYATDLSYMFYNCSVLSKVDLSKFQTSNVNDMSHMFELCTNFVELTFPDSFSTSIAFAP